MVTKKKIKFEFKKIVMEGDIIEFPSEVRKHWIILIQGLALKRGILYPQLFARFVEDEIIKTIQIRKELDPGIFCSCYGANHVLDIEAHSVHVNKAFQHYSYNMQRICSALQHSKAISNEHKPTEWIQANNDVLCKGTLHEKWMNEFLSKQTLAKEALQEKSFDKISAKGIFQCPSCKSFDVHIEQKQTRSSDEPMTNFCTCKGCQKMFVR